MNKKYDMVVKVGTYNSNGADKARWKTIGAVFEDDKGGLFAFMDKTFNPAGVPSKPDSESIVISFFSPNAKTKEPDQQARPPQEDNIPF